MYPTLFYCKKITRRLLILGEVSMCWFWKEGAKRTVLMEGMRIPLLWFVVYETLMVGF